MQLPKHIPPRSCAILLTTPQNPAGSIHIVEDLKAIGKLAIKHDLWIISDEVYEGLMFDGSDLPHPSLTRHWRIGS